MDVTQTLTWFDKWHARHKERCGVTNLSVHSERTEPQRVSF